MNNLETIDLAFKRLQRGGINVRREHLEKLDRERRVNKSELNRILGLNDENEYRKILRTSITETAFRKQFSHTIAFLNLVTDGREYIVTENKLKMPDSEQYQKLSRFLSGLNFESSRNIYEAFMKSAGELQTRRNMEQYVSTLIDICKPKSICISTNLYDFITSSTDSAYSSCYHMDGEHFNGNLSYLRDDFTVISFTFNDDILHKIGRAWIYVFPTKFKLLIPMRGYGSIYADDYRVIRKYIERAICADAGVRPYWKFITNLGYDYADYENADPGGSGAVYFDYACLGMAYHKYQSNPNKEYISFDDARCLECGVLTSFYEKGVCEDCSDSGWYCNSCDEYFNEESDNFDERGESICSYCFDEFYSYCEDCSEVLYRENSLYISGRGYICDRCSHSYSECAECNQIVLSDEMNCVDDGMVCSDCLKIHWGICKICSDTFRDPDGERDVCDSCIDVEVEA